MRNILTRTFIPGLSILSVAVIASVPTAAQEPRPPAPVHVIPRPTQLVATRDEFHLSTASIITLADPRSEDDRFAAQDFIDDVKETAAVSLKIGKARKQTILIGTLDQALVQAALKRVALEPLAALDAEGYLLSGTANEVVVAGKSPAGVFYGLQTLKQLVR